MPLHWQLLSFKNIISFLLEFDAKYSLKLKICVGVGI